MFQPVRSVCRINLPAHVLLAFCSLSQFQLYPGPTFLWILLLDCLFLKLTSPFSQLLTDSLKWLISFLLANCPRWRRQQRSDWLTYSESMISKLMFLKGGPSLPLSFGKHFAPSWVRLSVSHQFTTLRVTDSLKVLIRSWRLVYVFSPPNVPPAGVSSSFGWNLLTTCYLAYPLAFPHSIVSMAINLLCFQPLRRRSVFHLC